MKGKKMSSRKPVKVYQIGNCNKVFYTIKDAKKYALLYYGNGKEYVLHSGLYQDGDVVMNSGKKTITKG